MPRSRSWKMKMADNKQKKKTSENEIRRSFSFAEIFDDPVDVAQLDLDNDLNEDFFGASYELVERLVPLNKYLAFKIKRFVDILARMHALYIDQRESALNTLEKVRTADQKLLYALKTSNATHFLMEKLRESMEEAWRTADAAQYREALQQSQVDSKIKGTSSKITDFGDSLDAKDMLVRSIVFRERDRLAREQEEYQKRLEINRVYSYSLESLILDHRHTIKNQQIRVKQVEKEMYTLEHKHRIHLESLEEQIIFQRKELDHVQDITYALRSMEKKYLVASNNNDFQKQTIDRLSHENNGLLLNNRSLDDESRQLKVLLRNSETAYKIVLNENVDLGREIQRNETDRKKITDLNTLLNRRFHQLSKKNIEFAEREVTLNNEVMMLEKKLGISIAQLGDAARAQEEIERKRKKLITELACHNDLLASLRHDLVIQRGRTQDVQMELGRAQKLLDDKDEKIHKITRENHDLLVESTEFNKKIETLERKVEKRTEKIKIQQETLEQKHKQFLKVKKQMEIVQAAKTMLEKSLDLCGGDRNRLQNINDKLSFQVNQLCSTVATNEKDMITLQNRIDQLDNIVKHKQIEIHDKDRQLQIMRIDLNETKILNGQLQHTIKDDERRFKLISNTLEQAKNQKSLIGQLVVRRNSELRVLREKLSMMHLAINRGTMQYNKKVDDIRLLKTEITNLRMSNDCMQHAIAGSSNMRHEVVRLERQLLRERMHVAAFTEEMKYPYRIHRWRVLVGKDPGRYQLIRKVQVLIKRNVRLGAERVNLENKVKDIQRLYDTLKKQLRHIPDPSIIQSLWLQRRINQEQSRKVRAMQAELAINDIDLKSRDLIIDEYQEAMKKDHQQQSNKIVDKLFQIISIQSTAQNKHEVEEQPFHMTPRNSEYSMDKRKSCSLAVKTI